MTLQDKPYYSMNTRESLRRTQTPAGGLPDAEAEARVVRGGPNELAGGEKKSIIKIFLNQFTDLMIWVLMAAALLSGLLGEIADTCVIAFVVIMNAVLGATQEARAEAALEALSKMAAPTATVLRGGKIKKVPAAEVALGDICVIEAGDRVCADMRLIECERLTVDESALTGESLAVEKLTASLQGDEIPLGDRLNLAFMGTAVTGGRGRGVVTAVGMDTQMGAIAGQLSDMATESTPLQKKLNQISNTLSIGVLCIAAVIFGISMLANGFGSLADSFLLAISLAVAAIPEGLAAVVTIVLALGMGRMASRGAIIRRLPAVETLGSAQVICSDKTGTLTQNRMSVKEVFTSTPQIFYDAMAHCNDATPESGEATEKALIDYLLASKLFTRARLEERGKSRAGEIPFDSTRKRMTVAVRTGGNLRVFVKGAPDMLFPLCTSGLAGAAAKCEEMAGNALRVLAFAYKDVSGTRFSDMRDPESNLNFLGLAGIADPPRPEAKEAIKLCREAGIVPVMITGDHRATAVAVAEELGILGDGRQSVTGKELSALSDSELALKAPQIAVYARVSPEHKTRIVAAWRSRGKVVAMTGDGVNDAPALKAADIGVGMCVSGTEVSKAASDMLLTDDNFSTIVAAVGEGRRIFDNIHKTVRFLLSSNAGEILSILTATLMGWPMLAAIHILWVNLVTDTFPALALGLEPAERDVMSRKPRDQATPFFTPREWGRIVTVGAAEAALTLIAYLLGAAVSPQTATTMAFLTLSLSQLFAAVAFQSERHSVFDMTVKDHPFMWGAFGLGAVLQLGVVLFAPLRDLFGLTQLPPLGWIQVTALCMVMLLFIEGQKFLARRRENYAVTGAFDRNIG